VLNDTFAAQEPPTDHPLDLVDTDLTWARFRNLPLAGARLQRADMSQLVLSDVKLDGGDLTRAVLKEVHLENAEIDGATFNRARCQGAFLQGAKLRRLIARRIELHDAHMDDRTEWFDAEIKHGIFLGATLSGTKFGGAELQWANFNKAICDGVDFALCDLTDAQFDDESTLQGADFRDAILDRAHLERVDLSEAKNLTYTQLEKAFGNSATRLPSNVPTKPDTWPD
jgi:uncharacterized protein YjbI with pentapeptide repeats